MLFMDCIDLHLLSFESKIKKRCTFGNFVDSLEKRKHASNTVQWRFPGGKLKGVFAATQVTKSNTFREVLLDIGDRIASDLNSNEKWKWIVRIKGMSRTLRLRYALEVI